MKKSNLTFIFLILILIVFFFGSIALATSQPPREPYTYHLMVPLPTAAGTATSTTGIVDYIRILYFFGIGISAVIAMGAIIIAGFQWVTAGGSFAQVKSAKDRMSNALLGLVILLASFLILNTINPALVTLREPYLYFIDWGSAFPTTPGATGVGPGGGSQYVDCQDVIAQGGDCPAYRSAFGGLFGVLLPFDREAAFINYCNNDLCGLGLNCRYVGGIFTPYPFGGCVDDTNTSAFDTNVCSNINTCSDYSNFNFMQGIINACANNLCGAATGPCYWGSGCTGCSATGITNCDQYNNLDGCVTNGCGLNFPSGCFWQGGSCDNVGGPASPPPLPPPPVSGNWCTDPPISGNIQDCGDYTNTNGMCGPSNNENCLNYCASDPCGAALLGMSCKKQLTADPAHPEICVEI